MSRRIFQLLCLQGCFCKALRLSLVLLFLWNIYFTQRRMKQVWKCWLVYVGRGFWPSAHWMARSIKWHFEVCRMNWHELEWCDSILPQLILCKVCVCAQSNMLGFRPSSQVLLKYWVIVCYEQILKKSQVTASLLWRIVLVSFLSFFFFKLSWKLDCVCMKEHLQWFFLLQFHIVK